MVLIPTNTNTTQYKIESKEIIGKPRTYLGMSSIGKECLRAQWYSWRWFTIGSISARINRIFSYGHEEEKHIISDLKSIGLEVFMMKDGKKVEMFGERDEEQEEIVGFHSHCKGHPDGRVLGVIEAPKTEHLAEFKTMNDKNFAYLKEQMFQHGDEKGLMKCQATYYSQMQMYMGKLKLTRALFIATNKNDSARIYIRVHFKKAMFKKLEEKEENIILSELPPPKQFKADHFLCNWCGHFQVCHLGKVPEMNCRTCKHGDLEMEGKWGCGLTSKRLSVAKQRKGCRKYERLS